MYECSKGMTQHCANTYISIHDMLLGLHTIGDDCEQGIPVDRADSGVDLAWFPRAETRRQMREPVCRVTPQNRE